MSQSPTPAEWWVYIVECADRSLYTGITNDLAGRLAAHAEGKGAKYTKHRRPIILRYTETVGTKSLALRREAAIKQLSRIAKLSLIAAKPPPCRLPGLASSPRH